MIKSHVVVFFETPCICCRLVRCILINLNIFLFSFTDSSYASNRILTIIMVLHWMVVDSTTAETSTGTAARTTQTLLPTSTETSTPLSSSTVSMREASTTVELGTHSVKSPACISVVLVTTRHLAVLRLILLLGWQHYKYCRGYYIRQVNGVNGEIYCDAFFLLSVCLWTLSI